MSSSYPVPPWARPPPPNHDWKLTEIKGGIEVAVYELESASVVLGRASDAVDIVLAHESCSRRHARIALDALGRCWLRDLGSTHGTFVNKTKVPPQASGSQTEGDSDQFGSRGVRLFPGDVLQFGASTRVYCLEGPSAQERGAVQAAAAAAAAAQQAATSMKRIQPQQEVSSESTEKKQQQQEEEEEDTGISWGIDATDQPQEEEEEEPSQPNAAELDISKVPPKHRKLLERIRTKQHKLDNMQLENRRIERKAMVRELTNGQTAQLQHNAQHMTKLQREIENAKRELMAHMKPNNQTRTTRRTTSTRKRHREEEEYEDDDDDDDDDVDDLYDKTVDRHNQDDNHRGKGETEESLTRKWKHLVGELWRNETKVATSLQQVRNLQRQLQGAADVDAFFVQNETSLAEDVHQKALVETKELQRRLDETERVLRIVHPKLVVDRSNGTIGPKTLTITDDNDDDDDMPPPPVIPTTESKKCSLESDDDMPPPAVRDSSVLPPPTANTNQHPMPLPTTEQFTTNTTTTTATAIASVARNHDMPPPTKPRTTAARLGPPTHDLPNGGGGRRKSHSHVAVGTLSFVNRPRVSKQESSRGPTKKKNAALPDPKRDEWRAPEGQDGSGVTKLNAKFAGRY